MSEVRTIGLDLAKNVFQVHGADETGAVVCEAEPNADPKRISLKRLNWHNKRWLVWGHHRRRS